MKTAPPPLPVVAASGVWLELADGRRLLDAISSWWVNIHGHAHPRLGRALAEQAARLEQVIYAGFAHEPGARLAAALCARAPAGLTRVFYSDDGSTAVEVALKMAYQAWRHRGEPERRLFVALDDAYHGDTFGAMAAGGVQAFHNTFHDLFFAVRRVATPASRARGSTSPDLEAVLDAEGEKVAAVIVEPMLQGAGGMVLNPADFLARVRALTAARGIPLIADEVLTGFGRSGRFFACEHAGVAPDLLCVSKALTAGYLPLSATLATDAIFEAFLSEDRTQTFFHGHSFAGNALACAVALESLALFDELDCLARVGRLEHQFRRRLAALEDLPMIASTRTLGGMAAMDLHSSGVGGYLDDLGPRLAATFVDRGILLRPLGNVLYLLPPYAITDTEVDSCFDVIESVLTAL
jgi:adenosylmethionine-8-amino-7-oxononanoate aminotransferase